MFSVIIPTYNRKDLVQSAIESVLKQTYSGFEIVVVDDGSTDQTCEILSRKYKDYENITLLRLPGNKGRCFARNLGIEKAKYNWICFLDSDDIYLENHLMVFARLIQEFAGHYLFAALKGEKTKGYDLKNFNNKLKTITLKHMIKRYFISLNQLCFNKEQIPVRFPEERIPFSEDWLFIRMLLLYSNMIQRQTITSLYYEHPSRSMMSAGWKSIAEWNFYTGFYFTSLPQVKKGIKRRIESYTLLLYANLLLSFVDKNESKIYFKKSLKYSCTFFNAKFYRYMIKYVLKPLKNDKLNQ